MISQIESLHPRKIDFGKVLCPAGQLFHPLHPVVSFPDAQNDDFEHGKGTSFSKTSGDSILSNTFVCGGVDPKNGQVTQGSLLQLQAATLS